MPDRYVIGPSNGWLNVRLSSGTVVALPEFLKVSHTATVLDGSTKRDEFTILEGVYRNAKASVRQTGGRSNLGTPLPVYAPGVEATFHRKSLGVEFGSGAARIVVAAKTSETNPIAVGTHPIQIPDFPHDLGRGYLSRSSRALSWFYLGTGNAKPGDNDRYFHTGSVSLGCVTVTDVESWDRLYDVLIKSRSGDGRTVGKVKVVDD